MGNPIFSMLHVFDKGREEVKLGVNIGVVEKPIPTSLIAIH